MKKKIFLIILFISFISILGANTPERLDWYKNLGTFQLFTNDEKPATLRVEIYLGYKKGDKDCLTEITNRRVEIKEYLRMYFRKKTAAELKNPANHGLFIVEIKEAINQNILTDSWIRDIKFNQFEVVEQK